jgi:hypothetical protein
VISIAVDAWWNATHEVEPGCKEARNNQVLNSIYKGEKNDGSMFRIPIALP